MSSTSRTASTRCRSDAAIRLVAATVWLVVACLCNALVRGWGGRTWPTRWTGTTTPWVTRRACTSTTCRCVWGAVVSASLGIAYLTARMCAGRAHGLQLRQRKEVAHQSVQRHGPYAEARQQVRAWPAGRVLLLRHLPDPRAHRREASVVPELPHQCLCHHWRCIHGACSCGS